MAGGTFKEGIPKVRPGVYVNVKSGRLAGQTTGRIGTVLVPLVGYDWGPRGEFIEIVSAALDSALSKLGRSVQDDNDFMLMIRLAMLGAQRVLVYIPEGGTAATGTITLDDGAVTATAKYPGTLGNSLKVVSVANPISGFDVSVYLGTDEVERFEQVTDLTSCVSEYITFTGTGTLKAFASTSLSSGTDDAAENTAVTEFLDASEDVVFNCMAFPFDDEDLQAALLTKIKYIRENMGRKCQAVAPDFAADYEGIINLVNGAVVDGKEVSAALACAFVAGASAGADYTTSNTYLVFPGATSIVGKKTNEEAEESVKKGEMFFSYDENGNVVIEYDINSLVTFTEEKTEDYRKNRVLRVYDTLANELRTTFAPNTFDNNANGWDAMEGIGKSILSVYEDDGAIQNVDLDADFLVDRVKSSGDSTYINVAVQAVDAAEKIYFSVVTR